ncbi:hypothetical protein [Faecalispora sporosphaeroides]|uniref:hypothetical protein n=1 Tax=Faecalispora sporosphaeroides TaxID=1549 RepID=UPI00036E122B|nr:hypothetical protein [Faecalispora sporosphaeroides]
MKSKKMILAENPPIDQYVEQSFPVIATSIPGSPDRKEIEVVEYLGSNGTHKTYNCSYFKVEVVKDYDGFVSFIVKGESREKYGDVWIMRTHDFNRAYGLKNELEALLGREPNEREKMPCHGSLQREQLWWEKERTPEKAVDISGRFQDAKHQAESPQKQSVDRSTRANLKEL